MTSVEDGRMFDGRRQSILDTFPLSLAKDLIRRLLTVDAKQRISVGEALKHPWMQDEEVTARAKRLMGAASNRISMPPPPIPVSSAEKVIIFVPRQSSHLTLTFLQGRKRTAPTSDDDEATSPCAQPTKKPTLEASSPMQVDTPTSSAAPPTFDAERERRLQREISTASTTTRSLSTDSNSS